MLQLPMMVRRVRQRVLAEVGEARHYRDLVQDEYVVHLRSVVGGWLDEGNVRAFECAIRGMPEGRVLEIGSFLGLSTTVLAYACHRYRPAARVVACDALRFAGSDRPKAGYFDTGTESYRAYVRQVLGMNLRQFVLENVPHVIESRSTEFLQAWARGETARDVLDREVGLGGDIAFAYVDGDHTYAGAKADVEAVDRFLRPGGYLLLDDSSDASGYEGLRQLVSELERRRGYRLVMRAPNCLFRKQG